MTQLLLEAFNKAKSLPDYLQDELAQQLIADIENELQWQQTLSQPQPSRLDELARQALQEAEKTLPPHHSPCGLLNTPHL